MGRRAGLDGCGRSLPHQDSSLCFQRAVKHSRQSSAEGTNAWSVIKHPLPLSEKQRLDSGWTVQRSNSGEKTKFPAPVHSLSNGFLSRGKAAGA